MLGSVEEHEQLLHFLYAAPIGLVQTSLEGDIELINSASAKLLLPIAPERKLTNLYSALADAVPDLRQRVQFAKKLNCTVCDGLRFEIPAEERTQASLFVALSVTKVDGRRLIAVLTDISELVQHERALRQSEALYQSELLRSQQRLERTVQERTYELQCSKIELERRASQAEAASQAKSDFLANMSHEIRTPLNAILGNVELLRRDGLAPAQRERVRDLKISAEYLLSTLSDVLDLSKIEAGTLQMDNVEFKLDDLLDRVRAIVGDAAAAKKLDLQFEVSDVPQTLRGDPARLTQILVNYLSNAVKFSSTGDVRLRVRQVAEDATSCELLIEVHDSGIGFSEETSGRLFSAFERGPSGPSTRGAGLGLAINARLAALMNGSVGANGKPGSGSTFWLKVPLGKAAQLRHDARADMSAETVLGRDHRGATVLLVEDDPMNQAVALELLRDIGLAPVLARDGAEAVELVHVNEFEVILMDMKMPRLDGLQATAAIRALPGRERLPIVAMTANAFQEDRERCLDAGMNDFISKPFDVDKLCETLLRWLRASCESLSRLS